MSANCCSQKFADLQNEFNKKHHDMMQEIQQLKNDLHRLAKACNGGGYGCGNKECKAKECNKNATSAR